MRRQLTILFFLLFFAFSITTKAQDSSRFAVRLKLHPLAAINLDRPSIIGSIELLFKNKIGVEYGYGRRYSDLLFGQDWKLDSITVPFNGQTQFIELTFYSPIKSKNQPSTLLNSINTYIGVSYRHFTDLANGQKYYFPHNDTPSVTQSSKLDCYAVQRNVHIFVVKGGVIFKSKGFSTEFYGELGLRYKKQTLIKNEFNPDKDSFTNGLWPWENPYDGYLPTVNIGFKVNYQILNWR